MTRMRFGRQKARLFVHGFLLLLLLFSFGSQASTSATKKSLQDMIDATPRGETLVIPPGIYYGSVIVEKPITLDGQGKVTINGEGTGSVIYIDTDGASVRNLTIENSGDHHNDIDAGIQVRGNFNIIKDNIIRDCLFGIDLGQSDNNIIRRNKISSKKLSLGMRGDSIRLWYSMNNQIVDNEMINCRDMVVWYSKDNLIARNKSSWGRYALHFMYSQENMVEANHYTHNSTGIFLMYSDGVTVKNNYLGYSQGTTGMGVGMKESSNVKFYNNKIVYNSKGIYSDVSPYQPDTTNIMEGNLIAYNGIGILFHNDWTGNIARNNTFRDNLYQVAVLGGGGASRNIWEGNYWDDYMGFDANKDDIGDTPYRLYDYADRLWMDVKAAQFFKGTAMMSLLTFLEKLAPFSSPTLLIEDKKPRFSRQEKTNG